MKTNKRWVVEPIESSRPQQWGDVNPTTHSVEGAYGDKYRGAIDAKDSIITEENGFKNIIDLGQGVSPFSYIETQK